MNVEVSLMASFYRVPSAFRQWLAKFLQAAHTNGTIPSLARGAFRVFASVLAASFLGLLLPAASAQESVDLAAVAKALAERKQSVNGVDAWRKEISERRQKINAQVYDEGVKALADKESWKKFVDVRIRRLRESLGKFPEKPAKVRRQVTATLQGDGFVIENFVYETRPGHWVTANRYMPVQPKHPMPTIVVLHSHHNPKTEGELQDMGAMWARVGCQVLVPDLLGHGERRQHPFSSPDKYPQPFKGGRQDYWFRYDLGLQLQLLGESLTGWNAWDVSRGLDVLLEHKAADPNKVIVLGAVAGGGDPAAVVAALDDRVAAVVPFNFGGPQPETKFPLPADAKRTFNYLGGGSWESTRNLRLSGSGEFLPWVIVASAAPRRIIHAHEFAWDKDRDPAWELYQKAFALYGKPDHLAATFGKGSVRGPGGPDNTHCNNIGPVHRVAIHAAFENWFGIPKPKETQTRRPAAELQCLTPELRKSLGVKPTREILAKMATDAIQPDKTSPIRAERMSAELRLLLGCSRTASVETPSGEKLICSNAESIVVRGGTSSGVIRGIERFEADPRFSVPVLCLRPKKAAEKNPVVIAIAQGGQRGFLTEKGGRLAEIRKLLDHGIAVMIPDLVGAGARQPSGSRGRTSEATSLSSTEQMLGATVTGRQLEELAVVVSFARRSHSHVSLWGESLSEPNRAEADLSMPHDASPRARLAEPMGPTLAAIAGFLANISPRSDDGWMFPQFTIDAVSANGGLIDFACLLETPVLHVPHDAVIPGILAKTDLPELLVNARAPTLYAGMVDAWNRPVAKSRFESGYRRYLAERPKGAVRLTLQPEAAGPGQIVDFLIAESRGVARR